MQALRYEVIEFPKPVVADDVGIRKSSLVRAGLIPAFLLRGRLFDQGAWVMDWRDGKIVAAAANFFTIRESLEK